jgi:hypothetical protein
LPLCVCNPVSTSRVPAHRHRLRSRSFYLPAHGIPDLPRLHHRTCPCPWTSAPLPSTSNCVPPSPIDRAGCHQPNPPHPRDPASPLPSRNPTSFAHNVSASHWLDRIGTSQQSPAAHSPGYPRIRIPAPLVDAAVTHSTLSKRPSQPGRFAVWPRPADLLSPSPRPPSGLPVLPWTLLPRLLPPAISTAHLLLLS